MTNKAPRISIMYMRRYTDKFPELFETENLGILNDAISATYDIWEGIDDLFPHSSDKVMRIYSYLVCWYIAKLYPEYCIGVSGRGDSSILHKEIGGVKIGYWKNLTDRDDMLSELDTNVYGQTAKMLINTSANKMRVL